MAKVENFKQNKRESHIYTKFEESEYVTADMKPADKRVERRLYARYTGKKHPELLPGEIYVVEKVNMHSSSTDIILQGVSETNLNSIDFEFFCMENGKFQQWNIYLDKKYEDEDIFGV